VKTRRVSKALVADTARATVRHEALAPDRIRLSSFPRNKIEEGQQLSCIEAAHVADFRGKGHRD
jgi:hypothetical protein